MHLSGNFFRYAVADLGGGGGGGLNPLLTLFIEQSTLIRDVTKKFKFNQ